MPLHFLPRAVWPRDLKICSSRRTWPSVSWRWWVNASRNASALAALAIRGRALRICVSAL